MGRIVVTEFISLDGVMEDPGGAENFKHGGWSFRFPRGDDGDRYKKDELFASEALLLGRVTYQGFARAWPSITDPDGFADRMNSIRKYVVSSTLADEEANWNNTTVIRGDLAAELAKVKAEIDGDLLVEGSCQLAHALIENGLVDELRLMVFPIILGSGKRIFPEMIDAATLSLGEARTSGDGIVMLTYQRAPVESPAAG